ncbi:MAG: DNA polymerase III subunit gamma/tau [Verrucomicrobia bacterium]|nr:DNA polymerase III subunit gamma/tau [Verrucomicrobiota bacterium]
MSYQVFARKYRPRTFADLLGQDHVVRTLRNAIEMDRLAHAYLFVGPRGTGKTSTARIFAKALNCSGGPKIEFDPDEDICREIAEGISLDVLEIDGASNNGVDHVRELRETVKFSPAKCRYKIYYIDEVHMLSAAAFNALLKTLEEPPPHVKFIFATTEAQKVLPTIISRCQRFDLRRIPTKTIADHLLHIARLEKVELEEKAAYAIAKGADGGMRDAQSMLDQLVAFCGSRIEEANVQEVFGFTPMERIADMADSLLARRVVESTAVIHEQAARGRDLSLFLADLIGYLRHLVVAVIDPKNEFGELTSEAVGRLREQARLSTPERLLRLIDHFAATEAKLKWAPNKGLHLEIAVIKAMQILGETTLSDVIGLLHQTGDAIGVDLAPGPASAGSRAGGEAPPPPRKPAPKAEVSRSMEERDGDAGSVDAREAVSPARPKGPLSGAALWAGVVDVMTKERPLFGSCVQAAVFAEQTEKKLVVHFSRADSFSRDSLLRESNRTFVEELIKELAGKPLGFVAEIRDGLEAAPKPALEPEPPAPDGAVKAKPPAKKKIADDAAGPAPAVEKPAAPVEVKAAEPVEAATFLKDPMIEAAMELFDASLES